MSKSKYWSLRRTILFSVGSITLLLFASSMMILWDIHNARETNHDNLVQTKASATQVDVVARRFQELIDRQLPLRQLIARQEVASQQVKHEILRFVLQDEQNADSLQQAIRVLNEQHERITSSWPANFPQEPLTQFQGNIVIINDIAGELLAIRSPAQLAELADDARDASQSLVEDIARMREQLDISAAEVNATVLQSTRSAQNANDSVLANAKELDGTMDRLIIKTVLTLVTVILAAIGLQIFFFLALRRRLQESASTVDQLHRGDLTVRFDDSTADEIGRMMSGFNSVVATFQTMIGEIETDTGKLAAAVVDLSQLSSRMNDKSGALARQSGNVTGSSDLITANLDSMATTSEEMSVSTTSVSATIEQMSANIKAVAATVEHLSASINDIAESAQEGAAVSEEAKQMSQEASRTMNLLGETALDIGQVTEVIQKIAAQTNLLALNAAIEAASAGDAGRGFAVVANEIKELAKQSSLAAKNITDRIKGVQDNTSNAVRVIKDVSATIDRISISSGRIAGAVAAQNRSAEEISGNIAQTSEGITQTASSITQLAQAVNELSRTCSTVAEGAKSVSSNIHHINQIASESNRDAQELNISALSLNDSATFLRGLVKRFKISQE